MEERSTSETCSEAGLKVPIMFYNTEELIKNQEKKPDYVYKDMAREEESFMGVLSSLKFGGVHAVSKGSYNLAGV